MAGQHDEIHMKPPGIINERRVDDSIFQIGYHANLAQRAQLCAERLELVQTLKASLSPIIVGYAERVSSGSGRHRDWRCFSSDEAELGVELSGEPNSQRQRGFLNVFARCRRHDDFVHHSSSLSDEGTVPQLARSALKITATSIPSCNSAPTVGAM